MRFCTGCGAKMPPLSTAAKQGKEPASKAGKKAAVTFSFVKPLKSFAKKSSSEPSEDSPPKDAGKVKGKKRKEAKPKEVGEAKLKMREGNGSSRYKFVVKRCYKVPPLLARFLASLLPPPSSTPSAWSPPV